MHLIKLADILKTVSTTQSLSSGFLISRNAMIILVGLPKKDTILCTIFICSKWNFRCFLKCNKCIKFPSLACSNLFFEEQIINHKKLVRGETLNRKNLPTLFFYVFYWIKTMRPSSALFVEDSKWNYHLRLLSLTPAFLESHIKQDFHPFPGNYRPVSLTSIPGKVMEQLILDVISKQVEEKKVIRSSLMDSPRESHASPIW